MFKLMYAINWPAIVVLFFLPALLLCLVWGYYVDYGIARYEALLAVCSYYICNITVGIGMHRLWSHNSYKAHRAVEAILMLLSAGTLQGPVIAWASDHYKHHAHTDTDRDPHTPLKFKNKFLGFLWSHVGWMIFTKRKKAISRVVITKLGRNKLLMWQLRYYWYVAILMNIVPPTFIGFLIGGDIHSAYAGLLFIGLGRAVQQQMTFCINSWAHFVGDQQYTTNNTARDSWIIAPLLLGENWHNFHHAFPQDYRNGHQWYHFDIHKWIIYCLSKVGLAWDLNITPDIRIKARKRATLLKAQKVTIEQWEDVRLQSSKLIDMVYNKIRSIEASKSQLKTNILQSLRTTLHELQGSLEYMINESIKRMELPENSTDKMIIKARGTLRRIEAQIYLLSKKYSSII